MWIIQRRLRFTLDSATTMSYSNTFWSDCRATVCYGLFPSEWERPLCSTISRTDGCLPLAAEKLIWPVNPMSYSLAAVMTFPEKAFKGIFIGAHSSTMTASSTSPHKHLKNHNDYLTDSWLNALFRKKGMYSSGMGWCR